MIAFQQNWYNIDEFLPPFDQEVYVIYKLGNEHRTDVAIHTKDEDKINTHSLFFIDYLSPLISRIGKPKVLFWANIPEL